jgi:hypothetical protein
MRDICFQSLVGRPANPVLWEWCAYCPSEPKKAGAAIVSAVRRLKLGKGPSTAHGRVMNSPSGDARDGRAERGRL